MVPGIFPSQLEILSAGQTYFEKHTECIDHERGGILLLRLALRQQSLA